MVKKEKEFRPENRNLQLPEVNDFVVEFRKYRTELTKKFLDRKPWIPKDENKVTAFIPGTIQKVYVKDGDQVKEGEPMMVLEAMKMKNTIFASREGEILKIHVREGDAVAKNKVLIELKPD
ncbi:MAG: acetyl-CoA carboxylase biotin carboxyl carrier protein subunit [Bacteroidales bacterium]|nr:acetyl-CoA carboxylase biotin carboxyl carrier protein subunit [Bacteroidales bacterium]